MVPASSREDRGESKEDFRGMGSWKSVTMLWEGRVGLGGDNPLQKGRIKVRKLEDTGRCLLFSKAKRLAP